jgi:hypothetical protein
MSTFDFTVFLENYKQINNFMRENGIEHSIIEPGLTETTMTILDKHLSSPNTAHGGSMAGYMDSVLGFCALSTAIPDENLVSTVEFIVSIAEIFRGEEMVAHGQGTFNVYPLSKRAANFRI